MRELSLKIERLSELTTDELHRVAAAQQQELPTKDIRVCLRTVFGCTTAITCPQPDAE